MQQDGPGSDEDEDGDIEASIQKELDGMKKKPSGKPKDDSVFEAVRVGVDCLIFVRTKQPVAPLELVEAICNDAKRCSDISQRRSRFINRLTPITLVGKATENGVEEIAKKVLAEHFLLVKEGADEATGEASPRLPYEGSEAHTVRGAIRSNPLPQVFRCLRS